MQLTSSDSYKNWECKNQSVPKTAAAKFYILQDSHWQIVTCAINTLSVTMCGDSLMIVKTVMEQNGTEYVSTKVVVTNMEKRFVAQNKMYKSCWTSLCAVWSFCIPQNYTRKWKHLDKLCQYAVFEFWLSSLAHK